MEIFLLFIFIIVSNFLYCISEINAPECNKIIDCPMEYRICREGLCFIEDEECKENYINSNDNCCPDGVIDRGKDSDCILLKSSFEGLFPSEISIDNNGNIYFVHAKAEGNLRFVLTSFTNKGILRWKIEGGDFVLNSALLITTKGIYISTKNAVRRISLESGVENSAFAVDKEVKGNFSYNGSEIIAFITEEGTLFLYNENKQEVIKKEIGLVMPVFGPVFSIAKKVFYFIDGSGTLFSLNEKGEIINKQSIFSLPIAPFIANNNEIFIPVNNGKLLIYTYNENEIFQTDSLNINENIIKQPLIDKRKNIYLFTEKGSFFIIEVKGGKGFIKLKKENIASASPIAGVLTENNNLCYSHNKSIVCKKIIETLDGKLSIKDSFTYEKIGSAETSLRIGAEGRIIFLNEYQQLIILYGDGSELQKSPWPTLNAWNTNVSCAIY